MYFTRATTTYKLRSGGRKQPSEDNYEILLRLQASALNIGHSSMCSSNITEQPYDAAYSSGGHLHRFNVQFLAGFIKYR